MRFSSYTNNLKKSPRLLILSAEGFPSSCTLTQATPARLIFVS